MMIGLVLAIALSVEQPALKCAGDMDAMARDHRGSIEVIYRGRDASDFMDAFIQVVGEPPFEIHPTGLIVFRDDKGLLSGQFFDEQGCVSFGIHFGDEFFGMLRDAIRAAGQRI